MATHVERREAYFHISYPIREAVRRDKRFDKSPENAMEAPSALNQFIATRHSKLKSPMPFCMKWRNGFWGNVTEKSDAGLVTATQRSDCCTLP